MNGQRAEQISVDRIVNREQMFLIYRVHIFLSPPLYYRAPHF